MAGTKYMRKRKSRYQFLKLASPLLVHPADLGTYSVFDRGDILHCLVGPNQIQRILCTHTDSNGRIRIQPSKKPCDVVATCYPAQNCHRFAQEFLFRHKNCEVHCLLISPEYLNKSQEEIQKCLIDGRVPLTHVLFYTGKLSASREILGSLGIKYDGPSSWVEW